MGVKNYSVLVFFWKMEKGPFFFYHSLIKRDFYFFFVRLEPEWKLTVERPV